MDYAQAREVYFETPAHDGRSPVLPAPSPARELRDAVEPLATIGWWGEPAHVRYAALGLDFREGFLWSRASPLGDADPSVVTAAIGLFEPRALTRVIRAAREKCTLDQIRRARLDGAVSALREVLGRPRDVLRVTGALRRGLERARPLGRPLFAGNAALPWPDDELGALWHACLLLREYRFDGHIAACVGVGLDGVETNLLTELWNGWTGSSYTASRAWSPEAMDAAAERLHARGLIQVGGLSAAGRALRDGLEETTDASVESVVAAIGDELPLVVSRCAEWSARIIDRGWYAPSPFTRSGD